MNRIASLTVFLFISMLTPSALADIAAIQTDALPKETAVSDALGDMMKLEPYTRRWTANWKYPVTQQDAATRLAADMAALNSSVKAHPENVELLLLAGIAGEYGYNVDVKESYDSAVAALAQAAKLAPSDVRPLWFHAGLLCQTADLPANGATEFIQIEDAHDWHSLPPAFWTDYMECATITNMPAHALRAADHLRQLNNVPEEASFLAGLAQKQFDAFDPSKTYSQKEIWYGTSGKDDVAFTSTTCGVRASAGGNWSVNQLAWSNNSCVMYLSIGPYKETSSKMRPSILLMVQQPGKGESIDDYSKKFLADGSFEPFSPSRCPADRCIAMRGSKPGAYGKDGDGHGFVLIFERGEPAYPGLLFEAPLPPPIPGQPKQTRFYRPSQTQQRIPGKLYYVVLLDTATSIEAPALKDFDFFLQSLEVE